MAEVKFTKEQQEAIDTTDKSILVSASAGSGKTAVLIERIIQIILNGKANVDEMLVVTFTNAAAAEMKVKLMKAIKKEIKKDPSKAPILNKQLDIIYRSYISTFHSFTLRIIKEFFYMTELEPSFKIIDPTTAVIYKMEAMNELFEECFKDDSKISGGSFRDFLKNYSSDRTEDALIEEMLSVYEKLRSMPDYFTWAGEKAELLNVNKENFKDSTLYKKMATVIKEDLGKAIELIKSTEEIVSDVGAVKLVAKLKEDENALLTFYEEYPSKEIDDDFFTNLNHVTFATMRATKEEKEAYDLVKEEVKEYRKKYKQIVQNIFKKFAAPKLSDRIEEMQETYKYTKYYLEMLHEFEALYDGKKREEGLIDFGDFEHTAEMILKDDEVASTVRKRFKYIFIDEYQDTNYIQEDLIKRIARPNNVFKVGDVKQSIYRFRQSEPKIFEETGVEYGKDSNEDALVIALNRSYRSSGSVIDFINDVFSSIMEDYDDDAKLYKGLLSDAKNDLIPEVHLLKEQQSDPDESTIEASEESKEAEAINEKIEESSDEDDEGVSRSSKEAEAAHVAKVVKDLIGTPFFDSRSGTIRKAEPRDIAVLMRSVKYKADYYYRAMQELGITAHINNDDGYFDTVEIKIATALFSVIDNLKQDVPLIAVMRSEIFGFTPDELGEIRAYYIENNENGSKASFADAMISYRDTEGDEKLKTKVSNALSKIEGWRKQADAMQLDDFVWHVLIDSGYYQVAGAMYGGSQRQANLRVLTDRAAAYRRSGISSLDDFIRYINVLKKEKIKIGQAMLVSEEDNIVKIMTIHKSKGLEFPFVIIAGMGGKFNHDKKGKGFILDSQTGLGLSFVDRKKKYWRSTIVQNLIMRNTNIEERREDIRVLYVAMTRAKEKLILVGTVKDPESLKSPVQKTETYLQLLGETAYSDYAKTKIVSLEKTGKAVSTKGLWTFLDNRNKLGDGSELEEYEEVARRLEYSYPDEEALLIKAKYSVSEIRKEELEAQAEKNGSEELKRKLPRLNGGKKGISRADVGTAYHRIMEYIDFGKASPGDGSCDEEYIAVKAAELLDLGAIEEDVYNEIKLEKVFAFFRSDIGIRCASATREGKTQKEKAFTLKTNRNGRDVLVQGIIDCVFEERGKMVLIDYKSNVIRRGENVVDMKEHLKSEYKVQIDIYREAIEKGTNLKVEEAYLYSFELEDSVEM